MPTETRIFALKSDGSVSNQGPSTIRSVPKCTTAAWDASINGDDSDEELGGLIWKSSRTAKAVADAKKTEKCEHSANQNESSIPTESGTISKGDELGQKYGARQNSAVPTKRTIPAEGGDDSTPPKRSRGSPCSEEGCTNKAQSRGVCGRHGGRPTCSHEGCTNNAVKGGVCIEHGANRTSKTCSHDGCSNYPRKGGVCVRHGANSGAKRKSCSKEGCASIAKTGGVCRRHGPKRTKKTCSHEGCSTNARKEGFCRRQVSVKGTEESRSIQKDEVMENAPSSHQIGMCVRHGGNASKRGS